MKILVTGSRGFVGRYLVNKLVNLGHIVYEFDLGSSFPQKKVDVVFHLAANASVMLIIKNPNLAKENYDITSDVLEWMRKSGTKKIVFTSSREIYSLENLYGVSKKLSEEIIKKYSKLYGIKYAIIRMSNLYGRGDHSDRFVSTVIRLAKDDKDITIFGKRKLLNFVHIDDCVDGLIKSINLNGIFNLNAPKSVTLNFVASKIISLIDSKSKIIIKPDRKGETKEYRARPTPFEIKVGLEEGLWKTISQS
jgi:nucleoside-diphosphate-sugar epimerase